MGLCGCEASDVNDRFTASDSKNSMSLMGRVPPVATDSDLTCLTVTHLEKSFRPAVPLVDFARLVGERGYTRRAQLQRRRPASALVMQSNDPLGFVVALSPH